VISSDKWGVPEQASKVIDIITVDADYDLEQSFLIDHMNTKQ